MKTLFLNSNNLHNINNLLQPNNYIGLDALIYQNNIPEGTYSFTLRALDKSNLNIIYAITFLTATLNHKFANNWRSIETIEWYEIPETDIIPENFKITSTPSNDVKWPPLVNQTDPNYIDYLNKYLKQNKIIENLPHMNFKFFIKTQNETTIGKRDIFRNSIIDKFFCTQIVTTVGNEKTLGAICPLDPLTKTEMKTCMNWRRLDFIGPICKKYLNNSDITTSIENFCSFDMNFEDCKCINRIHTSEYQEKKLFNKMHDYCWYLPCTTSFYLMKPEIFNCGNSNYCQVLYNINSKEINFKSSNNNLRCFGVHNSGSNSLSEKKKSILINVLKMLFSTFICIALEFYSYQSNYNLLQSGFTFFL